PENPGERLAVKRNDQLAHIVPDGAQLSQEIGARLAEWARGAPTVEPDPVTEYGKRLAAAIKAGNAVAFWTDTDGERNSLDIPADRLEKMAAAVTKAKEVQ